MQTLVTHIENSDITNGDEFENDILYIDNVTSGDSFFLRKVIQVLNQQ